MPVSPLSWWTSQFTVAPVGHVLRRHLSDNWTRFHSLPESKRYAGDASEQSTILFRHLSVANELFEVAEPVYVFRSRLWERRLKGKQRHQLAGRQLRDEMVRIPTGLHADSEEDGYYCVRALVTSWVPDFFEVLTRQVADWEEADVTFFSPSTKNIYCPYDGGMDIFAFSVSPSLLEAKYRSWMSGRADRM